MQSGTVPGTMYILPIYAFHHAGEGWWWRRIECAEGRREGRWKGWAGRAAAEEEAEAFRWWSIRLIKAAGPNSR